MAYITPLQKTGRKLISRVVLPIDLQVHWFSFQVAREADSTTANKLSVSCRYPTRIAVGLTLPFHLLIANARDDLACTALL